MASSGPGTATPIRPSMKEFFDSVSIRLLLCTYSRRARRETRLFGRPLQVTVRPILCYGTVVLSVLSVCL